MMILGNAYEEIKKIPDHSIDLIITDPPYDIGAKGTTKGAISKKYKTVIDELHSSNITGGIDESILDEFMRVMKKPNIYIWCNRKQIMTYLDYFVKRHNCRYEILVWIKTNPIPACGMNYLNDKEYCMYFRKNKRIHTVYKRAHTYWITPLNQKDKRLYHHPTVKPLSIIEDLVLNSSQEQDTILDPFAGSGTTGEAAHRNNRKFIGIEMNEQHYQTAIYRIEQGKQVQLLH